MKKPTNTRKEVCKEQAQKASVIKLGLDVHADSVSVVRQIDGAVPQPAQKFTWAAFWKWIAKQLQLAEKVYSCYEAGPFGYGAHRTLITLGIENIVVRPQNWDELGQGVKTDKRDALALAQRLDRYVNGNTKALAVVYVPTPEQELARSETRLREQMRQHRQQAEAQGRSMLLYYGIRVKGRWWLRERFIELATQVPEAILKMVGYFRDLALEMNKKVEELTAQIEAAAAKERPKGYGKLTAQVIGREVVDWNRFTNRRQVASLTGLCPRVHASGNKRSEGSVSKHGNPRIRKALVELAWRVSIYQPNYKPVKRWQSVLDEGNSSARKKAVVAIARQLGVDLWRINTNRSTAENLGLALIS
jgi:transposase